MNWMGFTKGEKWKQACGGVMVKDNRTVCKNCRTEVLLSPAHSTIGDSVHCPLCKWVEKRSELEF